VLAHRLVRRLAQPPPSSDRAAPSRPERRIAPWLALLGVVGPLAGVAVSTPRPGVRGVGLGITLAAAAMLAGGLQLVLRRPDRQREGLAAMLLLGLAAAALAGLDPNSAGYIGAFIAVGALALRFERRLAFAGTALIAAAVTLAFSLSRTAPPAAAIASIDLGIAFVFAMATFAREQQRLLVELRQAQAALAENAALQERSRLAREIHDVLAHSLTGLSVQLEGARLLLAREGVAPAAAAQVERAQALARTGLEETRRAVGALRGDSMPGPEMLAELAASFAHDTGIPCAVAVSGTPLPMASEARLAVYRTAQEALSNVRKHAPSASRVSVSLLWGAGAAELTVADHDGGGAREAGLDLSATGGGYGLSGVRERAELLGGTLSAGPSGDGFRVHLRLPA
jgi:signal transduction histidine kinase